MKQLFALAFAALFLAACNTGWTDSHKKKFMDGCTGETEANAFFGKEQMTKICDCMMVKVMEKYPDPNDADDLSESEAATLAMGCMDMGELFKGMGDLDSLDLGGEEETLPDSLATE